MNFWTYVLDALMVMGVIVGLIMFASSPAIWMGDSPRWIKVAWFPVIIVLLVFSLAAIFYRNDGGQW